MKQKILFILLLAGLFTVFSCSIQKPILLSTEDSDPHSFSNPLISKVVHLDLQLNVNFETKEIEGQASYTLDRDHGAELILDNLGLSIEEIHIESENIREHVLYHIDSVRPFLGAAIRIPLKKDTKKVHIKYTTGPDAVALQWLPKEQTIGKKFPFLFTQSQSTYARSWIPCPDGPGMRFTYHANVRVPKGLMAVMSATNKNTRSADGMYEFDMEIPIPSYLLALAVGDFNFKAIGNRTGVYAEPELLDKAAKEFSDLEKMLITAEKLYGDYPWLRYDVIVLPASFPFGGMENPRMTFLTPSVIAGDQSLTSLLAHELAHSWSGNLVTNESWNDFWLNEGFTTYFESRIMEVLYGKPYADMLSTLGYEDLIKTISRLGENNPLTRLKLDLKDMDPEEGLTDVAYEKGKLLLRFLEERKGRTKFDAFLKKYFDHFKFKSNTSDGFYKYTCEQLLKDEPGLKDTLHRWIYEPGLLPFKPLYEDQKFKNIDLKMNRYLASQNPDVLESSSWTTHEWLYFIRKLPNDQNTIRCQQLESKFNLSTEKNAEIQCLWLEYAINNNFGIVSMSHIKTFLGHYGRRKFVMPIYEAMINNQMEKEAKTIFNQVKTGYHPITLNSVQKLLSEKI